MPRLFMTELKYDAINHDKVSIAVCTKKINGKKSTRFFPNGSGEWKSDSCNWLLRDIELANFELSVGEYIDIVFTLNDTHDVAPKDINWRRSPDLCRIVT